MGKIHREKKDLKKSVLNENNRGKVTVTKRREEITSSEGTDDMK